MKIFFALFIYFFSNHLFAQVYKGENDLYVILKGYQQDYRLIGSNAVCNFNMNDGNIEINFNMDDFKSLDSINASQFLVEEFEENIYPAFTLKANIPVNTIDRSTDQLQRLYVTAELLMGDVKQEIPIEFEYAFMDKNLLFDFNLILTTKNLVVTMPERYRKILTGVIQIKMYQGKLFTADYK
jgi:hypothetical protein